MLLVHFAQKVYMKILFVITSLDVGGAERQVLDLAQQLVVREHRVLIVYLTGAGRLLSRQIRDEIN